MVGQGVITEVSEMARGGSEGSREREGEGGSPVDIDHGVVDDVKTN